MVLRSGGRRDGTERRLFLMALSSSSSSSSASAPLAHEGRRSVDGSGQITLYDGEGRVVMVWAPWREHQHIVTTYYFDTGDSSAG